MQGKLGCEGRIRFGNLPWAVSERLAQFSGSWLAYAPDENAIMPRPRGEPLGCPPVSGIPCELITMIDLVPPDQRDSMPGGSLSLQDKGGRILTLVVERGEVRIQWPRGKSGESRVMGWTRFAGSPGRTQDLQAFADRFHGLFPEGDLPTECEQNLVYVEFRGAAIGEAELLHTIAELADPRESVQAELEISTPGSGRVQLRIKDGNVERSRVAEAG